MLTDFCNLIKFIVCFGFQKGWYKQTGKNLPQKRKVWVRGDTDGLQLGACINRVLQEQLSRKA